MFATVLSVVARPHIINADNSHKPPIPTSPSYLKQNGKQMNDAPLTDRISFTNKIVQMLVKLAWEMRWDTIPFGNLSGWYCGTLVMITVLGFRKITSGDGRKEKEKRRFWEAGGVEVAREYAASWMSYRNWPFRGQRVDGEVVLWGEVEIVFIV